MPILDLARGPHTLSRYDVIGMYADKERRLIAHVGLHDADRCSAEAEDDVYAVHMRPPLGRGEAMKVHVAGHVPLTSDEIKELSAWIAEVADEYHTAGAERTRQYVVDPPWKDEVDPNTRVRRYRRYSCVGFVLDGYRQVSIELLKIEAAELPEVDRHTIAAIYPMAGQQSRLLPKFGLCGDGPWRVVLPGYVLHALNRTSAQIRQKPYCAEFGNERF